MRIFYITISNMLSLSIAILSLLFQAFDAPFLSFSLATACYHGAVFYFSNSIFAALQHDDIHDSSYFFNLPTPSI